MEIRVLRYFLTVVREESITRAAERLHITQPALSRQLTQLEEEVGVKLFERGTRKITLTDEGILLRRRAEEITDLADQPIIMASRSSVQNELANWFGDYFKSLQILFKSNLTTNGAIMVQRGLGYSLVIEGSIPFWDKEKICSRPLYPELTATSVLAWKRHQPFSRASMRFIEHIKCFPGMNQP